jgi:hypothetical protein
MIYDNVNITRPNARIEHFDTRRSTDTSRFETLNRKNNTQRGMRGIILAYPAIPLVTSSMYYPQARSKDVYFDQDFISTLAYEINQFSGYLDVTIRDTMPDTDLPTHHTESPLQYAGFESPRQVQFVQAHVDEMFDSDVAFPDQELPILDGIQRYRINDITIDLYTKFLHHTQPTWNPHLFEYYPEQ